jgi:hypothetical protein
MITSKQGTNKFLNITSRMKGHVDKIKLDRKHELNLATGMAGPEGAESNFQAC